MTQYIDKSALVAEIEKTYNFHEKRGNEHDASICDVLYGLLHRINTLEVKEVDLELMLHEYWNLSPKITIDCLESATMTKDEMINFAKHFFELGLKVQKGEEV